MPKIVNFLKKVKFKKKMTCLRATISVGKCEPILKFCIPSESCGSPLFNGANWSRVLPRVHALGCKMQGGSKKVPQKVGQWASLYFVWEPKMCQ